MNSIIHRIVTRKPCDRTWVGGTQCRSSACPHCGREETTVTSYGVAGPLLTHLTILSQVSGGRPEVLVSGLTGCQIAAQGRSLASLLYGSFKPLEHEVNLSNTFKNAYFIENILSPL